MTVLASEFAWSRSLALGFLLNVLGTAARCELANRGNLDAGRGRHLGGHDQAEQYHGGLAGASSLEAALELLP